MQRWRRRIVLILLLAGLVFRVAFVSRDIEHLVTLGPLYDDSFYCFGIARNIAQGVGATFDGTNSTNGYQPLYVALLVPLYWLSGDHSTSPIYAALLLSALCNVLTGLILYRLARRFVSWEAAVFGLVLWGFGPAIVRQAVNGLETSLALLLLAAALEYYVTSVRPSPQPSRRQAITLGALLGLGILARVDALLFCAAVGLDWLWVRRKTARWRSLGTVGGVALLVTLPWCVTSWLLVGSVVPESGRATRFLSEAYAPHDVPAVAKLSFEGGPPPQLLLHNLWRSLMLLGTSPAVHVYTRGLERFLVSLKIQPRAVLLTIATFLIFVMLAIVFMTRHEHQPGFLGVPRELHFLFGYSVMLIAAYALFIFGQIFYSRYYYPVFFFSVLISCFVFEILMSALAHIWPRRRRAIAIAVIALYAAVLPYMTWGRLVNGNYQFLRVVDWIAANTSESARIGVFNAGAIGYFSDRHVVNLDGKVNRFAFRALVSGGIRDYVIAENIDYVIDHEWILERFLFDGDGHEDELFVRVADGARLGVPGWRAYRIERSAIPGPATVAVPHASR